jgi:Imm-5 like putative immunity protein
MDHEPDPLVLNEPDRRLVGDWAADCAERVLPLFEARAPADTRPRQAIEGIRTYARGGRRTAQLRELVWAAYAAAREVGDPCAAAAARAAGLAAGTSYTHTQVTPDQVKHVLGPAAYAARARQLAAGGAPATGSEEIRWAIGHASLAVREIIRRLPACGCGRGWLEALIQQLEAGFRR